MICRLPFSFRVLCVGCAFLIALGLGGLALAQTKPAPDKSAPAEDSQAETPLDTLRLYTFELIDGMTEKQLQYVYVIRTRHGIVRAVEVVRRDVGKAVGLCGKAHKDMKTPLEARFTRWKDTVNPLLEDAQNVLERDIANQDFVKQDKIRKLLTLTTKAGDYTDSRTVKEIVTTPEACEFLLKNMDLTQKDLPELLRASLNDLKVPDPESVSEPPAATSTKTQKAPEKSGMKPPAETPEKPQEKSLEKASEKTP